VIQLQGATVYHGNNLDILPTLPDNSIDAIVTDPPYELGFMGKSWDASGIAYNVELWRECLRVLKPGGHLLSFGGSRTFHRIAVAIEDAGFEIRDNIAWLYGSGFPKSLDISKAIDKAAGAEREVLGPKYTPDGKTYQEFQKKLHYKSGGIMGKTVPINPASQFETAPATPEAEAWNGWGTALKPAFEPVIVARKPLIGTVAQNVLEFGTGGLNIDGSRIGTEGGTARDGKANQPNDSGWANMKGHGIAELNTGRWPANLILDEYTAELLDEQSGNTTSKAANRGLQVSGQAGGLGGELPNYKQGSDNVRGHNDSGGASRFFYIAKASKADRNEGLDEFEPQRHADREKADGVGGDNPRNRTNQARQNFHPTVKPTQLMRYLIRLVTPPGGVVLDPFTGSGSTGKAAILEGFNFIGIELTAEYLPIIEGRLKHAVKIKAEEEAKKDEMLF
jgi:site-specific DNA-methyltransferase (adenine-specific)